MFIQSLAEISATLYSPSLKTLSSVGLGDENGLYEREREADSSVCSVISDIWRALSGRD